MSSPSNIMRKDWRAKCRVRMSEYLEQKLGMQIAPECVRLKTSDREGYRWNIVPNAQPFIRDEILHKDLSKHSIGAYKQLYYAIGLSVEAIRYPLLGTNEIEVTGSHENPQVFKHKRNDRAEAEALRKELAYLSGSLEQTIEMKVEAESLSKQLQSKLREQNAQNHKLKERLRNIKISLGCLRNTTTVTVNDIIEQLESPGEGPDPYTDMLNQQDLS